MPPRTAGVKARGPPPHRVWRFPTRPTPAPASSADCPSSAPATLTPSPTSTCGTSRTSASDWHAGVGDGFALPDTRVRGLARCAKPKDAETGGVGSATPDVEEETWHRFWSEPDYDGGKFGNDPPDDTAAPDDTIAPDDDDGNAPGTRPT